MTLNVAGHTLRKTASVRQKTPTSMDLAHQFNFYWLQPESESHIYKSLPLHEAHPFALCLIL